MISLNLSRQFRSRVLPFRANHLEYFSGRSSCAMTRLPMLTGKLLPPVNNGLNFHQTREDAAEAACVGISKEFCDTRQALA